MKYGDHKWRGRIITIAAGITILALMLAGSVRAATHTVCSSGCDYSKIQDAINAAIAGDTILVYSGIYFETVIVNKQLVLLGQNGGGGMPIINGVGMGDVIYVTADKVTIDGFKVKNCGAYCNGIKISSNNNLIINNNVSDNEIDIFLSNSNNNTLTNNTVFNSQDGIYLGSSLNNTLNDNLAYSIGQSGIHLSSSNNNTLRNNNVSNFRGWGILLQYSRNNILKNNNATGTTMGGEFSDFNLLISNVLKTMGDSIFGSKGIIFIQQQ